LPLNQASVLPKLAFMPSTDIVRLSRALEPDAAERRRRILRFLPVSRFPPPRFRRYTAVALRR
jgi:hypothetical protein